MAIAPQLESGSVADTNVWFFTLQSGEIGDPGSASRAVALVADIPGVSRVEVFESANAVCLTVTRFEAGREARQALEANGFPVLF